MPMDGVKKALTALLGISRDEQRGLEGGRGLPPEIAHGPARLGEDEARRSIVPGHEPHLEVKLGEPRCHEAQLHGGAAGATHIVTLNV